MSSFERDALFAPRVFRPTGPAGPEPERGFAAGIDPVPAATRGRGPSRAGDGVESAACSPARHAELERAAFEKGRESAQTDWARCERACAVFEAAAGAMGRASLRMLAENRERMLVLSAEIARAWLGEELRVDPARLAHALDRALALCDPDAKARIVLHPEMLAALEASAPDWFERIQHGFPVELTADASLAPVDFRIQTGSLSIEAGVERLAARLRGLLAEALEAPVAEVAR